MLSFDVPKSFLVSEEPENPGEASHSHLIPSQYNYPHSMYLHKTAKFIYTYAKTSVRREDNERMIVLLSVRFLLRQEGPEENRTEKGMITERH